MSISPNQFKDAQRTAIEYAKTIDTSSAPSTWLPTLLETYENELIRLNEHRELMLVIADMAQEMKALRENQSRLEQALIVIAADDLLERPGQTENQIRMDIAKEALAYFDPRS